MPHTPPGLGDQHRAELSSCRGAPRARLRPWRVALGLVVVPVAAGLRALRLWVLDGSKDGPDVSRVDGLFDEATVTWLTRPRLLSGVPVEGSLLGSKT